jgi:5'-methylthioadenosine phosphorylase
MGKAIIGVMGGSGVYQIDGLHAGSWQRVASPFGDASDEVFVGDLDGITVAFLPRHGRGHRIPPSEVNYRANIDVFKRLGVTDVLSLSAVGSLREDLTPGTFVIVDQFIDRTFARAKSFFKTGMVAHVSMAHPVCARLGDAIEAGLREASVPYARGGTYLVMEGPQFSTRAESELYRAWKCDVIGMTNMPEAKLAREAELCYATIAMVTDFDCWHPDHGAVSVADVIRVVTENSAHARSLVSRTIPKLAEHPDACASGCDRALDAALMTASSARDETPPLEPLLARVLRKP